MFCDLLKYCLYLLLLKGFCPSGQRRFNFPTISDDFRPTDFALTLPWICLGFSFDLALPWLWHLPALALALAASYQPSSSPEGLRGAPWRVCRSKGSGPRPGVQRSARYRGGEILCGAKLFGLTSPYTIYIEHIKICVLEKLSVPNIR